MASSFDPVPSVNERCPSYPKSFMNYALWNMFFLLFAGYWNENAHVFLKVF